MGAAHCSIQISSGAWGIPLSLGVGGLSAFMLTNRLQEEEGPGQEQERGVRGAGAAGLPGKQKMAFREVGVPLAHCACSLIPKQLVC